MPARNPLPLLLLLALLLAGAAPADEFMVYGTRDGYPKYFEQDGQAKGIVVDITKLCLSEMQVPFQIKLLPWKRAYTMGERGEGGVIGLSLSDERLAIFDFSAPILTEHTVLVVKKGREFAFEKMSDLHDKLIGVVVGASYGTDFDEAVADGDITTVGFNNTHSGLAMLQRERIDAILIGSSVDIARLASSSPDLQGGVFATLPVPLRSDSKHLGIAKSLKMGWFLQRFNQCLSSGQASGAFAAIIDQYRD
ncbi:MAG TPA: transporter substrate-binding domain-containing protein [Pseudomonas sp.]|nr:transporter substrate-binding domain-containing protein [Pseudomonas sp.]